MKDKILDKVGVAFVTLFLMIAAPLGCCSSKKSDPATWPVFEAPSASLEVVAELQTALKQMQEQRDDDALLVSRGLDASAKHVAEVAQAVKELRERVADLERMAASVPPVLPLAPPAAEPPDTSARAAEPPAASPNTSAMVTSTPEKLILAIVGEGCSPCDGWKQSPDPEMLKADGYVVQLVDVGDAATLATFGETPGGQIPRFKVYGRGGLFVRHKGHLHYSRVKEIERAIERQRTRFNQ